MEKVIYEKKGLPKKMKRFLMIAGGFLAIVGIVILVYAFTAKSYTGWNGYSMGSTVYMSHSGGISDGQRKFYYIFGFLILLVGAVCLDTLRSAKNNYIKVYETMIEGSGGFGFLSKKFQVKAEEIQETVVNPNGLLPTLLIKTKNAQNYFVFIDNPAEVERIIRKILE